MRSRWLGLVVLAVMWIVAAATFSALPERVPTHWNLQGEVDGWTPRMPGAFLGPAAAALVLAILYGMRWIDPRRRNVEHFARDRYLIANLLALFFLLLQGLMLAAALGWAVDVAAGLMAGLGLLLAGIGNYLPRIRSNWWLGIRTPWTLDSERIWRDTHRLGGRLFVAGGALLVVAALLPPEPRGWLALVVLATIVVIPIAYSFLAWRREAAGRS